MRTKGKSKTAAMMASAVLCGGVYRLNRSNLFYANVTRGFGGDYKMEWKVNAGLRFAF